LLIPGILMGLAAITRPSGLVLLPVILLDIFFFSDASDTVTDLRKKFSRAVLIILGCLLPILPVTLHNLQRGDFALIATQGGVNFYIGNNPTADGQHAILPGVPNWDVERASLYASRVAGRNLSASEVSSLYYQMGRKFIFNDTVAWVKLTFKKFCAFWNAIEVSNNRDLYFFKHETAIMPILRIIGFWLVAPLGIMGIWIGWRKKLLPKWFVAFILIYMLSVVLFFVSARFRAPVIPFLIICAAVTLTFFQKRRATIISRERIIMIIVLHIFIVFVNTNPWDLQKENTAHAYFSLGTHYLDSNQYLPAKQAFEATIAANPNFLQAHLNLGITSYRTGDMAAAERHYMTELQINPGESKAINNLGNLRVAQGRYAEARELYQRVLELERFSGSANITQAHIEYTLGMEKAIAGENEAAAQHFRQALKLDNQKATYHYSYALITGRMGDIATAKKHLGAALQIMPEFKAARELLNGILESESKDQ
jgi:Tfp pilus assembly protein PilF